MDESLANIRHERSKKDFPALKLEDGEYVEFAFVRSKICYWLIWGCVGLICFIVSDNQSRLSQLSDNICHGESLS